MRHPIEAQVSDVSLGIGKARGNPRGLAAILAKVRLVTEANRFVSAICTRRRIIVHPLAEKKGPRRPRAVVHYGEGNGRKKTKPETFVHVTQINVPCHGRTREPWA